MTQNSCSLTLLAMKAVDRTVAAILPRMFPVDAHIRGVYCDQSRSLLLYLCPWADYGKTRCLKAVELRNLAPGLKHQRNPSIPKPPSNSSYLFKGVRLQKG